MARYHITEHLEHGATAYKLVDSERRAEAILYPEFGNNCVEFRTTPGPDGKDASGEACASVDIFQPPANLEDLRTSPFHGGQPILFPFPNRVREGRYSFEGRDYKMDGLLAKGWDRGAGQAIHGLVADKTWAVDDFHVSDQGAVVRCHLQLDAYRDIFDQYPFPCRITVTYRLLDGVLEMHTEVANKGEKTLPMGFGIHPWFPVRLQPGVNLLEAPHVVDPEVRAGAMVRIPASAHWELEKLMPTGNILSVDREASTFDLRDFRRLDAEFYDDVFTKVLYEENGWSESALRDPVSGLEVYIAADSAFREWVLYAPLDRPVVAMEPYTCTTDAVNLQAKGIDAGLIALPPGKIWRGNIRFGLRVARE